MLINRPGPPPDGRRYQIEINGRIAFALEWKYAPGEIWHMGLPTPCYHPNIKWENDFYVGRDHGTCPDCNGSFVRACEYLDYVSCVAEIGGKVCKTVHHAHDRDAKDHAFVMPPLESLGKHTW